VAWSRAALGLVVAVAVGLVVVSGGSEADPRTPAGLPGLPPPFLGTAVVGSGGRTIAVDSYGNVVDLRTSPAGRASVEVSSKRQAAGTVSPDAGIVARMPLPGGGSIPLWRADWVRQHYLRGTNVLRTVAGMDSARFVAVRKAEDGAAQADRRWLAQAQPLGPGAPGWARAMHARSLLVLRALTDRHSGAVAAGARNSWAYVWPRDAGAVAIAFAAAGYRAEARRIVRFLRGLDLDSAARFNGDGSPVAGRTAQGDAAGWVATAERDAELPVTHAGAAWQGRADYQEGAGGDYIANAIASGARSARIRGYFARRRELVRVANDPGSGIDSAVAWAVRPFPRLALFPLVRRSLRRLVAEKESRFGIVPSQNWHVGEDPWTAQTAWTAWAFAALASHRGRPSLPAEQDRRTALRLMHDLRRAATPLGLLPERVDAQTGLPTSTTPLAWSHAFAILALRELWPS
jgi:hypothetical protein